MPNTTHPKNQERFVQLLRGYLRKTGRKQVELARASNWSESMLSKVLKGKTPPNLGLFCTFQAPFLVAHGGVTQARQVDEMTQLLGHELDEAGLLNIAKAVERFKDPELDTIFFRDRAEEFRKTIPAALNRIQTDGESPLERAEPAEIVLASPVANTRRASTDQSAQSTPDEVEKPPTASAVMAAALADWQAVLRELVPPVAVDTLEPDEVIAAVLQWESRQTDERLVAAASDWFDSPATFEKLRQRARLDFMLQGHDGRATWNQLEWQWLNHVLVETAQRQAGGSQPSPTQIVSFVTDLGRVAFEAVKAEDGNTPHVSVNLAELAQQLPMAQVTSWNWLNHIAQTGLVRLSIGEDGICQFASREEAEFLSAQYLLHAGDETLLGIARNCGRPFGVLAEAVRTLHFTGRDVIVGELIGTLLKVSEDIPLRYADAAYLLSACEATASKTLLPLWDQVLAQLRESWAEVASRDFREYVARALRYQDCPDFVRLLRRTLQVELLSGEHDPTTLRCLALVGGPDAVDTLKSLGDAHWLAPRERYEEHEQPWDALSAVLAVVPELAPSDQVAVLESLALGETASDGRWRAVKALADAGSLPAIRALERIAAGAPDMTLARNAQTQRVALDSPAYAALVAQELDAAIAGSEPGRLALRLNAATGLLARSTSAPSPTVSRSVARVWAKLDLDDDKRIRSALSLIAARASAALDLCLGTLPLADLADGVNGGLVAQLLPAVSLPAATPRLWPLVDRAPSPAQRVILIQCLGRAGGLTLGERFEQLLAGPSEQVAAAGVAALAESLGPAAAGRLAQIAGGDTRREVRAAAYEGLAEIGSEQALPYLREKLKDAEQHAEACRQLARQPQSEAEMLLVEAARTATDGLTRDHVCLPALAKSGGATAIQGLRDLLGSEPDEVTLRQVRAELAPDTVTRATDVWGRLVDDPSPAWRMLAVAIIVQDSSQSLIAPVVRLTMEETDRTVRAYARDCLLTGVAKIESPAAAEYVLHQLEQQIAQFGQPAVFVLEMLGKCLSGLSTEGRGLPSDIARRTLAVLGPVMVSARPTDECFIPLLAAFGYPEFGVAAGELERWLDILTDAEIAGRVLETLIAIQAPGLPDLLIRLAKSTKLSALQARASDYLAEVADYNGLAQAPNELKHLAYRVAIRKGIRFRRDGLRHKVILASGRPYVRVAQ